MKIKSLPNNLKEWGLMELLIIEKEIKEELNNRLDKLKKIKKESFASTYERIKNE